MKKILIGLFILSPIFLFSQQINYYEECLFNNKKDPINIDDYTDMGYYRLINLTKLIAKDTVYTEKFLTKIGYELVYYNEHEYFNGYFNDFSEKEYRNCKKNIIVYVKERYDETKYPGQRKICIIWYSSDFPKEHENEHGWRYLKDCK